MTSMIFGLPGGAEWFLLLLVALLIFGGSRLAGLGKGAGQAIREFKEETKDLKKSDVPAVEPAVTLNPANDGRPVGPVEAVEHEVVTDEVRRADPPRV